MRLLSLALALPLLATTNALSVQAVARGLAPNANPLRLTLRSRALASRQASTCSSSCSSASDTAAVNGIASCSSSDITCLCTDIEQLSAGCLTCVLAEEGLTQSEISAACAGVRGGGGGGGGSTVVSSAPGGSGSSTTSSAAASSSSAAAVCDSQCSSTSDQSGLQEIANCAQTDTNCICSAAGTLSSACLTCTLSQAGISASQWSADCAGVSSTSFTSATATTTVPSSTTSTAPAPASSSSAAGACDSQCASASDQAAIQAGDSCSQSDTNCICSAGNELSSACMSCYLVQAGLTPAQWASDCAGASSASASNGKPTQTFNSATFSRSTSGTSASSSPSPNVGSSKGEILAVGGLLGLVLAAMAVLA